MKGRHRQSRSNIHQTFEAKKFKKKKLFKVFSIELILDIDLSKNKQNDVSITQQEKSIDLILRSQLSTTVLHLTIYLYYSKNIWIIAKRASYLLSCRVSWRVFSPVDNEYLRDNTLKSPQIHLKPCSCTTFFLFALDNKSSVDPEG